MKTCKGCRAVLPLTSFYQVNTNNGRTYWMGTCNTCTNAATAERKRRKKTEWALRKQAAGRAVDTRKLAAAMGAMPLKRVSNSLRQRIEQVIARFNTGDSLEFAAWRVGIDPAVVRAWMEAA